MNTIDLKQERAKLINEAQEIVQVVDKEQRSLSVDEQKRWDDLEANITKLESDIDYSEKREKAKWWGDGLKSATAKTSISPGSGTTAKRDGKSERNAFRAWLKLGQAMPLSAEERSACDLHEVRPHMTNYSVRSSRDLFSGLSEQRAMAEGSWTLSSSGNAAPLFTYMSISDMLDTALKSYGNLLNTSTIISTPNAWPLPLPTANDTSNSAAIISENGTLTPANIASTATVTFGSWKYFTAVTFSTELLKDALFNLESWLAEQLGVRLARGLEGHLATGSGSGQPNGICTAATNCGVTVAGTTAAPLLTFDNVISLMNSVDPSYLQQTGCGFVGHQSVISLLMQVNTTGRYIWSPGGLTSDQSKSPLGTIYGYPVIMNNSFPAVNAGSGDVLLLFGQLKKYHVRKVNEIEFLNNPYIQSLAGQIVLQCFMRADGNLVDSGTHPVKYLASP
jgi:HK97 family phage major capsid protein